MAWLLLAACGGGGGGSQVPTVDAPPPDAADPCMAGAPPVDSSCVSAGLDGVDLNGAWTFTGTYQPFGNVPSTTTFPVTITVTGTGWCHFDIQFTNTHTGGYVDTTQGYSHYFQDMYRNRTVWVCRHDDGAIWLHDDEVRFGDSPDRQSANGTLAR